MTPASTHHQIDRDAIREILAKHGRMPGDARQLAYDADLYSAGLSSLATVGLMLALENHFDVEFPEEMLGRSTFRSIDTIASAIGQLAE